MRLSSRLKQYRKKYYNVWLLVSALVVVRLAIPPYSVQEVFVDIFGFLFFVYLWLNELRLDKYRRVANVILWKNGKLKDKYFYIDSDEVFMNANAKANKYSSDDSTQDSFFEGYIQGFIDAKRYGYHETPYYNERKNRKS